GSLGTALAVLLARAGIRTTLHARTPEQARELSETRANDRYLPGLALPGQLRVEPGLSGVERADYVFLAVPCSGLGEVIATLAADGLARRAALVSLAKGLVPPHGLPPTVILGRSFPAMRVACVGGPAPAQETGRQGAAVVPAW